MQRPNDQRRDSISAAAAHLFATRPFHEVRLDDIARQARVGKGTLYVYFKSKESIYLSLVREGFRQLVDRLQQQLADGAGRSEARLRTVVEGLTDFAFMYPDLYRVMRTKVLTPEDAELQSARRVLSELIESVLRDGVRRREIRDPHPEITAQFMLSFVRGALLYPPKRMTRTVLCTHMTRVLLRGIGTGNVR